MKYLLKAITTNNRDLKTAILFTSEEVSYLFNCPDGFQRIALCSKMRFQRVKAVFISQLHPDYFGGFPGFYLSTREATGKDLSMFKMHVFGPEGLTFALNQAKSFIGSLAHIQYDEYQNPREFDLTKKGVSSLAKIKTSTPGNMTYTDHAITIHTVALQSPDQRDKDCYSFIGIPTQAKGKFQPQKALQMGCNPKVHFKMLNDGMQVTLQDGSIIYPFQVMDEPVPSQAFILIFMPNENYLESLLSEDLTKQFAPYFAENIDSKNAEIAYIHHSVPLKCLLSEHYKDFMRRFGPKVKHVIDCHEVNDDVIGRTKAYTLVQRHKIVCPSLFPLYPVALSKNEVKFSELLKKQFQDIDYIHAKLGLVYNLFPTKDSGYDQLAVINNTDIFNKNEDMIRNEMQHLIDNLIELARNTNKDFPTKDQTDTIVLNQSQEPEILFLGTVSMKPTMYRSASAIMVFVNNHSILMDCAEGSYGQLWDHYQTKEKVDEVLKTMRVIFITHIHGDHQLGVLKIMLERDRLIEKYDPANKLYIVTPAPMFEWMELFRNENLRYPEMVELVLTSVLNPETTKYYLENENNDRFHEEDVPTSPRAKVDGEEEEKTFFKDRKVNVPCPQKSLDEINQTIESFQTENKAAREMIEVLYKTMGITQLLAIETDHCIESYACLINSPVFGRILYSGDTCPCQNLINYAQNVTLLIHEATFSDGMEQDAFYKKHTTTGQVMKIAEQCKPWRTVLTHFSPRYQKIAEISDSHLATKTMVSFDHMRIRLSQFEWAYNLLDIYRKVFTNEDILDDPNVISNISKKQTKKMKV